MLPSSRAPEGPAASGSPTYKSIVLLSLIICLRKGYAFEHLEQFHLHALLRRALRKVRGSNYRKL